MKLQACLAATVRGFMPVAKEPKSMYFMVFLEGTYLPYMHIHHARVHANTAMYTFTEKIRAMDTQYTL